MRKGKLSEKQIVGILAPLQPWVLAEPKRLGDFLEFDAAPSGPGSDYGVHALTGRCRSGPARFVELLERRTRRVERADQNRCTH